MRDQVVKWMLEVCEEQRCNLRTFPQAVDILDRYLSGIVLQLGCHITNNLENSIEKKQLQLAGIGSIYISSKIVECLPLNVDTCVMYTDYSITKVYTVVLGETNCNCRIN